MKLLSFRISNLHKEKGFILDYDRLSPGVNIIFGPNGSGKTSTIQATASLLSTPFEPFSGEAVSIWEYGSERIEISIDEKRRFISSAAFEKQLPGPLLSRCYAVTIDELFSADDSAFVSLLLKEVFGGVDLEAVEASFNNLGKQHGYREKKKYYELKKKEEAATFLSNAILEKKEQLLLLERKIAVALDAKGKMEAWEKVENCKREIAAIDEKLFALPKGFEHLRGDELQKLQEIDFEIASINIEIDNLQCEKVEIVNLNAEEIAERHRGVQRLYENEVALAQKEKDLARANTLFLEECRYGALPFDFVANIDIKVLSKIAEIISKIEDIENTLGTSEEVAESRFSIDRIRKGIYLLQDYLDNKDKLYIKLLLLAVAAISSVFFVGFKALVFLPFTFLFWKQSKRRYRRLGLVDIDWSEQQAIETLAILEEEYLKSLLYLRKKKSDKLLLQVANYREELQKFPLDLSKKTSGELVKTAARARELYMKVQEGRAEITFLTCEQKALLGDISSFFEKLGYGAVKNYSEAVFSFSKLDDMLKERERQRFLLQKEAQLRARQAFLQNKKSDFLKSVHFTDELELKRNFSLFSLFEDLKKEKLLKSVQLSLLPKVEFKTEEIEEARTLSSSYEDLLQNKKTLENELAACVEKQSLLELGSGIYQAREEFQDKLTKRLVSVGALFWIDKLRGDFEKKFSSPFFEEAKRAFRLFTGGDFELLFPKSGDNSPIFHVLDLKNKRIKNCFELSRGTRMQLLLALRLGYVKSVEKLELPFFFDEVLSTSDEARFSRIARTLTAIGEGGRQIFYFTCRDEENRWRDIFSDLGFSNFNFLKLGEGTVVSHI